MERSPGAGRAVNVQAIERAEAAEGRGGAEGWRQGTQDSLLPCPQVRTPQAA